MKVILTEKEYLTLKDKEKQADLFFKDNLELKSEINELKNKFNRAKDRAKVLNEQNLKICRYVYEELFNRKTIFLFGENGSVELIDADTNKHLRTIEYKEPITEEVYD